jgi:uncharacterized protein YggT (Ycf19 family)
MDREVEVASMYRDSEIGVVFHHGVLSRSAFPLRLAQALSVLFSLVYGVLVARFLLEYVQAGPSPFVLAVARITDYVYLPLRHFFANGHDPAGHPVAWSIVVAIGAIAVVQWSIIRVLRAAARPRLEVEADG